MPVFFEELKVLAPVKDIELAFVSTVGKYLFAESRAAPNHLDILDAAIYGLEEHEVQDVRHVDARIQHIHGNGYLW